MSEWNKAAWVRIYHDMLDDYTIGTMKPAEFVRKFRARVLDGEENEFSRFIKPGLHRPHQAEWARLRKTVFERDDYTCAYCGKRGGKLECDHIVPVAKGGEHEMENLATACFRCNRSKRDKDLNEWIGPND